MDVEYIPKFMLKTKTFDYQPKDYENEKASQSYLMSVIAIMVGLPLPIINLIATLIFYLNNKKSSYYVRWHCTQALLSQLTVLIINSGTYYWTLSIIFGDNIISNSYIAFLISVIIFNLSEFILTVYTAIQAKKGKHIEWFFWGDITNLVCKPENKFSL